MNRKYALVSVGETLGDILGTELSESLADTRFFERFQGGSPANLALNMNKLGLNTALVSCLGNDNLGKYLFSELQKTGTDLSYVCYHETEPSSIVLVSRTQGSPDFIPYRGADCMLEPPHIPDTLLAETEILHTTTWPLSRKPAQNTVLDAAKRAVALECKLSIDLNYAYKVWPNKTEAHDVIKTYLSYGALIKLSEDDAERFFGEIGEAALFDCLFSWGAQLICFTKGSKGAVISTADGRWEQSPKAIEVIDATGAGDAFWSGFLTAYLHGLSPGSCAEAGSKMAAIKLQTLGPIDRLVGIEEIL
jgi:sugar/nucleoside kinase (ribokinase family)